MNISVIGAGNGGQAIAGYCASLGISVCLYNRSLTRFAQFIQNKKIKLIGCIEKTSKIEKFTDNIKEAIEFSDIILIAVTASAHKIIAEQISPYLRDGQIILLNPGRTCGVLEFSSILNNQGRTYYIAEAQTLMFACREIEPGTINIIGIKQKVMLSGRNKQETNYIINKLRPIFSCFIPAENFIQTGLENIGAIFHPPVVIFNAATIERNNAFYFYRDMTPAIANFIERLDKERINIGLAYNINLMSVNEWIKYAYPNTTGDTLCERMKNNPAYHEILAPCYIFTRQLT